MKVKKQTLVDKTVRRNTEEETNGIIKETLEYYANSLTVLKKQGAFHNFPTKVKATIITSSAQVCMLIGIQFCQNHKNL